MTSNEGYYYYLLERAGVYDDEIKQYSKLFHTLYVTEFQWKVPMDENRAIDGAFMRKQYTEDTGEVIHELGPCSFLEMVVGLASRCEYDVMHDGYEDNTREWFWDMLGNCGLIDYDNHNWKPMKVREIINTIIFRKYNPNGYGGFFPLKNPVNDQRKVELWYQLHAWLHENYS